MNLFSSQMSGHRYRIGSDFVFKESDKPGQRVLRFVGIAAGFGLVVALLFYAVFALTINTDVEGRLKRENKMYEKLYPQLIPQQELLEDAVSGLEMKDGQIYKEVFQSNAPAVDPIGSFSRLSGDMSDNAVIIAYASERSDTMYRKMFSVEANLRNVLAICASGDSDDLPPLHMPVKDISFTQIGASIGMKTNPVLKARVRHNGLDMIVSTGTDVFASASGRVKSVERNTGGKGNMITIVHESGYMTRYAHLSTMTVRQGSRVKTGQKIGTVGTSGSSFAPHLHYEVLKDGLYLDPVNFFFASVDFKEYANMFYMASNTEQSMD